MLSRASGILLHVSSLPSDYGIGDLGAGARGFADILNAAGQRCWQMLPLNPTDGVYGESPYSSPSAFACNPLFLSPALLNESGWLTKEDLEVDYNFPAAAVDFSKVRSCKTRLFEKAFQNFQESEKSGSDYDEFCRREGFWLESYAAFTVLKEIYPGKRWDQWPEKLKRRDKQALEEVRQKYAERIQYIKFLQFAFDRQWRLLRSYCAGLNIKLIGDIPIYVNEDSADVWADPHYFKLDSHLRPVSVAGVPPDYFSETGQRWGNPVYDWDALKAERYEWWMRRLQRQFELFDIVRIDHFRGFEQYWEIPAEEPTAVNGRWADGPKDDFFKVMKERFSDHSIIGEDLGIITEEVTALMERFDIPGMKVLQFAFGGDLKTHPYIPENYTENCVVYTGTHDNNTTRGWFEHDATEGERRSLNEYLNKDCSARDIARDLVCTALSSCAFLAVIPFQDILNIGQEARMNVPGTACGNWLWRYQPGQVSEKLMSQLRDWTKQAERLA